MKCAYGAGVLDVLLTEKLDRYIDYGIGVSAGSANLASFEAGQIDRNRRFYVKHSQDKRYFSISNFFKTGSLFGLQYIYGDLTNEGGGDPLDYDAMMANPMEMYIVATDGQTGQARYFNKTEVIRNDYRPIMASCCLPVASKVIEYQGHYYFDGGVADSIPVGRALADGCSKLIFVSSKPAVYAKKPEKTRGLCRLLYGKRFGKMVDAIDNRHNNYNDSLALIKKMEGEGSCLSFYVPEGIKIGTFNTDPALMQRLYDAGVEDAQTRLDELKAFMEI